MLYIFLDFDGVLHTHNGKKFSLVNNFAHVVKKYPEVKIVFSTSWREYSTIENLKEYLPEIIHKQCIGVTPWFKESMKNPRFYEIQQYLEENKMKDNWLAIDDLASLFPPDCKNLFLVDGREGISASTAKLMERKIKYMLRKSSVQNNMENKEDEIITQKFKKKM